MTTPTHVAVSTVIVSVEPVTVDMPTACAMLGIGESYLKTLMHEGRLNGRKLGKRTVFVVDDLKTFAAQLPSWEPRT